MTATIELSSARRKLQAALGDQGNREYFFYMKSWFRKRISKEEFDLEARKLLVGDHAHLHNEFLLAILNKCQTLANLSPVVSAVPMPKIPSSVHQPPVLARAEPVRVPELSPSSPDGKYELQQQLLRQAEKMGSPAGSVPVMGSDRLRRGKVKRKSKSGRPSFDQRFQPTHVLTEEDSRRTEEEQERDLLVRGEERATRFCHREPPLLPDVGLIHGRMLLTAWEERLEGVADRAVELVLRAVEGQLRRMVMAMVMRRRAFRMRDGRFPHAVGVPRPNPWLFNTQKRRREDLVVGAEVAEALELTPAQQVQQDLDPMAPSAWPTAADAEQRAMYEVACAVDEAEVSRGTISPFDLLAVMQERRSVIPCHTVYALNVERVIARLYHGGHDD